MEGNAITTARADGSTAVNNLLPTR